MKWLRDFRSHGESFPNVCYHRSKLEKYPLFLENNPDFRDRLNIYAREHLQELSTELLYNYVIDVLLPELLKQRQEEENNNNLTVEDILKENGLRTFTVRTMNDWMHKLKYKYSAKTKTYYVDGHENPDTVAYRKQYCTKYIRDELRCFRWFQLCEEEVLKLEQQSNGQFKKEIGYKYNNSDGLTMFEFHVDDHESFATHCNLVTIHGGYLSVRKPPDSKPLIMIGQDECIFKQHLTTRSQWHLPDGTSKINPKTDGDGLMLSSFQSRDFGFGLLPICCQI